MAERLQITSVQNPRVKDAAKLRDRKHRDQRRQFLIDGAREIKQALAAGVAIGEVFVCEALCQSDECREALGLLRQTSATHYDVTEAVFAKLAYGERADGVVVVAAMPEVSLDQVNWPAVSLVAVIEGVEKPGNLGAILRSADGAGVTAVLLVDGRTDFYNANCIRASLGTVFTRPVVQISSEATLAWLRKHRYRILAARVDGAADYTQADYQGNVAIVLGSEADGLSLAWRANDIQAVKLPLCGSVDSLNVSATAAVLFYEALRQRSVS